MMDTNQNLHEYRYERKTTLNKAELLNFYDWLKRTGIEYYTAYPDRWINNIYFDTPDFNTYNENSSGESNRKKARLRWYGDVIGAKKFQFELKVKKNQVGYKLTAPISSIDAFDLMSLYENLRAQLPPSLKMELDQVHHPSIFNRYHRKYFASTEGVRITIDTHLQHTMLRGHRFDPLSIERSGVESVIEIKYAEDKAQKVKHLLGDLPFVLTKNSKFINAVDGL